MTRWTENLQIKAEELRSDGISYEQIARTLDVGSSSVFRWLNPEARELEREKNRSWKHSQDMPQCCVCKTDLIVGDNTSLQRICQGHFACYTCISAYVD